MPPAPAPCSRLRTVDRPAARPSAAPAPAAPPRGLPLLAAAVVLATSAACSSTLEGRRGMPAPAEEEPAQRLAKARRADDVAALLETSRSAAGESLRWPDSLVPWIVSQVVTIAPGETTGWHRHGVPTYGYLLSGTLEVEYEGLGRRVLTAGDALMEAMTVAHTGTNLGTEPVRILVVFMGAQGRPLAMKADPPSMPAGLGGTRSSDLVDLAEAAPSVRVDLRYAGTDNFTGRALYPPSARARLQRPAAEALRRAGQKALAQGYALLVLDAYRPWSVTRLFWDEYPMHREYLADPLEGSRHNRGCAVDVTLVDAATGREAEMPSGYDDFRERAHPDYAGGTSQQRAARDLLRRLMQDEGFAVHEREWWHFDFDGWQDWPVLDEPIAAASSSQPRKTPDQAQVPEETP